MFVLFLAHCCLYNYVDDKITQTLIPHRVQTSVDIFPNFSYMTTELISFY